jgi:hypothetical protein
MLTTFLDKLLTFPLWVKQVIFLKLHEDMSNYLSEDFITVNENNIFHIYVPELSFLGEKELVDRKCGLDNNIYNFLGNVNAGLSVLEIAMNNFWTMEEVSKYFIFCLEQEYIKAPYSDMVHAMAGFMSGKFRTGEYFKRAGKININQLDKVVTKQKELRAQGETGESVKIAEIMIEMGLVSRKDTTSLLVIKEEAKKRFILDASIVPAEVASSNENVEKYKEEIKKLEEKNALLKDQLTKVLAFVKKNG